MDRYLIDTNIWSALIRGGSPVLYERFVQLKAQQIFMSSVVYSELELGFQKGDQTAKRRQALDGLLELSTHLMIDMQVAKTYAQVRAALETQGTPIGRNDTWIAAEALHHKLIVVTDNVREFERVEHLKIENWL